MDNINTRWAQIEDAEALGLIHAESWKAAYKNIMPEDFLNNISIEKRQKRFEEALLNKTEENAVILCNDKIVGFICLGKARDEDLAESFGEIWGIYLYPEQWGKGFGRKLISWGIKELENRGCNKIVLWVLEENYKARGFYENIGFRQDGTFKDIKIGKFLKEMRYVLSLRAD